VDVQERRNLLFDIETTGLNPGDNRIICIGTHDTATGQTHVFHDQDEKQLIQDFINYIDKRGFTHVTAYSVHFDRRFVGVRALKHRIHLQGFSQLSYEDPMEILAQLGYHYSMNDKDSLDHWAKHLLGREKQEKSSDVPGMYDQGEIKRIKEYCRDDVEILKELWELVDGHTEGDGFIKE
jgi:uncharacterized protein YprB with RNaseH-like and TPR domain